MQPITDRILTGTDLRGLSIRSNARGTVRTGIHLALLTAGGTLVTLAGPWTLGPAMVLFGIVQAALFAPVHETMHQTAFASRRANAVVGWLAACPSLLNWHFYTAFHLAHHRHTQDPERDPELMALPAPDTLDAYLLRVAAVPYWRTRLRVVWDGWRGDLSAYPFITPRAVPRVIRSLRGMSAGMVAAAMASMVLVGWWAPLVYWLGPQLLGQPLLRLYLLTEHTGCSMDANGLTNTRTTLTSPAVRLLMWNMSFHTEHHLYPSIPFHRLADAHGLMRTRLGVVQHGYVSWHAALLRRLLARSAPGVNMGRR